jgi:hypothetical protein
MAVVKGFAVLNFSIARSFAALPEIWLFSFFAILHRTWYHYRMSKSLVVRVQQRVQGSFEGWNLPLALLDGVWKVDSFGSIRKDSRRY